MANTYHQIYLQTVFAVKYRAAVLDKAWRNTVQGVIGNLINETGCKTIIVNGVEDHMYCFLGLKPVVSASELMKTETAIHLLKKDLNGRKATGSFLTGKGMLTRFISMFKTRKPITRSNLSKMSILNY